MKRKDVSKISCFNGGKRECNKDMKRLKEEDSDAKRLIRR